MTIGTITRKLGGAVAVAGASLALLSAVAPAAQASTSATLRKNIAATAVHELSVGSRNHEIGGYNCNYYSSALGVGTTGHCSHNSWRTEEWCADFSTWVWRHNHASISGLTPGAASFYAYGRRHNTWHRGLAGVKVGDAVVIGLNSTGTYAKHVGIVTSTTHGVVYVSGNSGPHDTQVWRTSLGSASGYTTPVQG